MWSFRKPDLIKNLPSLKKTEDLNKNLKDYL